MPPPRTHDIHDIVVAATRWLMQRYRQTGCSTLARLIEQHLCWIETRSASPQRAAAYQHLSREWRADSDLHAAQTAIH